MTHRKTSGLVIGATLIVYVGSFLFVMDTYSTWLFFAWITMKGLLPAAAALVLLASASLRTDGLKRLNAFVKYIGVFLILWACGRDGATGTISGITRGADAPIGVMIDLSNIMGVVLAGCWFYLYGFGERVVAGMKNKGNQQCPGAYGADRADAQV